MRGTGWRRIAAGMLVAAGVAFGPAGHTHAAAIDAFKSLRQALTKDKAAQNWTSYLAHARQLETLLNGSAISHLEVARAEMKTRDVAAARKDVAAVLAMGQMHPILQTPLFGPLHAMIAAATNAHPVAEGTLAFAMSDPGLLVEDIAYDARTARFFLSSVLKKKIVVHDAQGRETTFAQAPDGWPVLALKVDAQRRRLWATEVAFAGFDGVAKREQGRSAVLEYDLESAKLLARVVPPFRCALGDMALAPDGEALVSDGEGGGVYRLHAGMLARIDRGEFISPQTIAVDSASGRLYVPDYLRGIGIVSLSGGAVRWIAMQDRYALDGVDGLYFDRGALLATQNGTAPERVAEFVLDAAGARIVRQRIIERATPAFGDPTHGVVVGDTFYYIVNSGWDKIDEHGRAKAGTSPTPARVMRASLRAGSGLGEAAH